MKEKLKNVPNRPGSYQMKDKHGHIIYVGKAKDLKKRLSSYFTGSHDNKTTKMLQNISDFDYIITDSELEAYILELDLIKKYQPRYNILLTDDKSYPYIEITKERHPKMIVTRRVKKKHRNLFGPYPNVKAARDTIQILNKLYPLRQCQTLPKEPCLYYHLGQCLAPCIHKIEQSSYREIENKIRRFLKGQTKAISDRLNAQMSEASDALEFERASEYKAMLDAIKTTTKQTKQGINLKDERPIDLIAVAAKDTQMVLVIFFIRNGKISAMDKRVLSYHSEKTQAIQTFLGQFYQTYPQPHTLLLDETIEASLLQAMLDINIAVPKRGEKRRMMNMAKQNAIEALKSSELSAMKHREKTFDVLDELADLLGMPTPYHIEAFDNSHLFGEYPVSAMVSFKNAKPAKNDYRKYNLKESLKQSGDTDQMKEVLYRRFRRILMDQLKQPDLIILDGGINQLNAAKDIKKTFALTIPLISLVKDAKHKTSHLLDESGTTFEIRKDSELFKFLTRVQDEAHRFAITFHQNKRHKGLFESKLDDIKGIGKARKQTLLKTFKTTQAIKNAKDEDLRSLGLSETLIQRLKEKL